MNDRNGKEDDYKQWENLFDKKFGWLKEDRGRPTVDYSEKTLGR